MPLPEAPAPPLLSVQQLRKHYRLPGQAWWRRPRTAAVSATGSPTADGLADTQASAARAGHLTALDGVSLKIEAGHSLGVVGESGSGKSTLARLVMALERPSSGSVHLQGQDLFSLNAGAMRQVRSQMQMVFQDPYGSLDPRRTVLQTVAEPLAVLHRAKATEQAERAAQVLSEVGLRSTDLHKYPHEFSGGQRQRIAIARALITRPALIVADEPVSALDVSVQAQVLNLMQSLQERHGVTYLFISHDLAVVSLVCDEVIVLHQGRIVEQGSPQQLFSQPQHAYTQRLLQAVPGRNGL